MNHKKSAARVLTPEPNGGIKRPSQLVLARLSKLARTQKGQIAAVEMESQEIFLGKNVVEATLKGWKKYPNQSFYFVRIGYRRPSSSGRTLILDGKGREHMICTVDS